MIIICDNYIDNIFKTASFKFLNLNYCNGTHCKKSAFALKTRLSSARPHGTNTSLTFVLDLKKNRSSALANAELELRSA